MPGNDWIVGGNRRTIAAERIYAAATDLITRYGLNALDIDKLAREVHCSRATIYRRAGGKAQISAGCSVNVEYESNSVGA